MFLKINDCQPIRRLPRNSAQDAERATARDSGSQILNSCSAANATDVNKVDDLNKLSLSRLRRVWSPAKKRIYLTTFNGIGLVATAMGALRLSSINPIRCQLTLKKCQIILKYDD